MRRILTLFTLILSLNLITVQPAFASPLADVTSDQATISFPISITFKATISSSSNITSVILEYGTDQLTCGEVVAKAFPQFTPRKTVNVEWTWDMRQSTSLPPGATIWWRWRYTDETGKETISNEKTITWLDDEHNWKTISKGNLNLHSYGIGNSDAQNLLNAGLAGLDRNEKDAGLKTNEPIDIYIYPSYDDLREAILFESSWTGGRAFPDHNIVILGVSGGDDEWDKDTVVHELTHVLVGHLTFSCLGFVPQWLNEGLAVYSEGPLDPQFNEPLQQAIQENSLLSVRSISNSFTELPERVNLPYGQSYSLVNFLIETYGQDKMNSLLMDLRDGTPVDDALMQTYGFNIEGLEDAWRASIGAAPRSTSTESIAQPTPTYVPTIVPISGAPIANQLVTPTPIPTSSFGEPSNNVSTTSPGRPPLALTLILLGMCCIFLILIGVVVLGFIIRAQNRKGGNNA